MNVKAITEKDDKATLDGWKERARTIKTPEDLAEFVKVLTTDYQHDYGTIVHAMHAAMKAAMTVVNESPQGGITGFQASCLGWMQIADLFSVRPDDPVRLVNYADLLYPQYEDKFNSISEETWKQLQERAKVLIAERNGAHPSVLAHWQSVAAGNVPFGLRIAA